MEKPELYPQNRDDINETNGAVQPIAEIASSPIRRAAIIELIILYACEKITVNTSGKAKEKKFLVMLPSYNFFNIFTSKY